MVVSFVLRPLGTVLLKNTLILISVENKSEIAAGKCEHGRRYVKFSGAWRHWRRRVAAISDGPEQLED